MGGTNYWKSKVLPKIKKVFEKNNGRVKKAAAAEATKIFDDSKEQYNKEFEEKKIDLQPKVVQIYEASSLEFKSFIKEPKDAGLKKHSADVQKLLDDLVKIEFPGSKPVSEACSKFGPAYVSGPVLFVFEKVSSFIVTEEEETPAAEEKTTTTTTTTTTETEEATTTTSAEEEIKEKEIVVIEQEKKEEAAAEETETPAPPAPSTEPAAAAEVVVEAPTTEAPAAPAAKVEAPASTTEAPVTAAPEAAKP